MDDTLIKFTKIKLKEGKVHLEYEREINENTVKKTVFDSFDEPDDDFVNALQALKVHVEKLLELPDGYLSGGTPAGMPVSNVSSISLSWTEGIMGAVVTVLKTLDKAQSPLVLNSPHLPEYPYGENETPTLPFEMAVAIGHLKGEATLYLEGKRKNTQLKLVS